MAISRACNGFAEDLSALLDGELDPLRAAQVREHIEVCTRCEAELEALGRVDSLLRATPVRSVSTDLRARLETQIAAANRESGALAAPASGSASRGPSRLAGGSRTPRRPGFRVRPALGVAAAAALAAALVLILLQPGARNGNQEPTRSMVSPAPTLAAATPSDDPIEELLRHDGASEPAVLEIAVALELDTLEDLDVIANLELLERWIAREEGSG